MACLNPGRLSVLFTWTSLGTRGLVDSMSVSGATAGEEPGADMLGSASVGSGHDAESMASRAQLSIKKMEKKARCDVLTGRARVACDRFLLTHHIASRPWAPRR